MATVADPTNVKSTDEVKSLREQIELALLQRIQASIAQATAAELRDMLALYQEVVTSDWYKR
jgi:hypothetical protein